MTDPLPPKYDFHPLKSTPRFFHLAGVNMSVLGVGHNSECNWVAAGLTAFKLGSSEFNDENPESCKNLCSNTLYNTYTIKNVHTKVLLLSIPFWCGFSNCSVLNFDISGKQNNSQILTNFSVGRICIFLIGCWDRVT